MTTAATDTETTTATRDAPPGLDLRTGVGIAGCALAMHFAVAQTALRWRAPLEFAVLLSFLAMALVVVLAVRGPRRASQLGLRRPSTRFLVAGIMCGLGVGNASEWIGRPIVDWLGPNPALAVHTSLLFGVVVTTLLGPLGEELVFRGVLVRSFATRWSWPRAIAVSALAFMLYHCNPYQLSSPFIFGLVAGLLTLRSGSLVPSNVAHVINNAQYVLGRAHIGPDVWRWAADHQEAWLAITALLAFTGVAIAATGARDQT